MSVSLQHHRAGMTWLESGGMARSAHALADGGRVWLIDPFEDEQALQAAAALGELVGVVQLLDRHNRDCRPIAEARGVPLLRVPDRVADGPFEVVRILSRRVWKERALWWPQMSALVVAEAIGTAPAFALGRRAGIHPMLRLTPPRSQLTAHRPEILLVGHGETIESDAAAAIEEALAHSRSDVPRLVVSLPKLLRGVSAS